MNITLIRPPKLIVKGSIGTGAAVSSSIYPTAPLGMVLIAASLRSAGHNVSVIDGIAEGPGQMNDVSISFDSDKMPQGQSLATVGISPAEILSRIPQNTEIIAISCMFTHNWLADRALLNYLSPHFPQAIFIAGGESITGMAELCLKQVPALTICVLGEGEETAVELLSTLEKKEDLSNVKGIIYKNEHGAIIKTERRSRLRSLDEIPLPAWDMFPIEQYEKQGRKSGDIQRVSLPILATRGCPYTCTFCTSPDMWGTRYYMRTPTNVADEMEMMYRKYNVTNFEFYDLTAIIQKRWIIELAKLIIDRKLDIYWRIPSGTRSEAIDEEVAKYLKKSGCYTITYAPESGSARLLELIHKKVKISSMLESISYSKKHGLYIYINMIQGLPEEKHYDIWQTAWFLIKCAWTGVDELSLGTFRPYPGTELFNRLVKERKIEFTNDDYFLQTLLTIETEESFYNENVSPVWYRFYNKFFLVLFYGASFLFQPKKFFKSVYNISKNRSDSRFEKTVLFYLNKTNLRASS